jgi:hypothetical protein
MSCEPPLVCGTPLDGSEFGFAIDIPAGVECDGSLASPNEIILGFVTYRVTGTDTQIIIIAADASNSDNIDGGGTSQGDCNDLGDYTNANGLTFERCMFTSDQGVSYAGFAEIPNSETRLLISIVDGADDPSFPGLLESVLDGVSF